MNTADALSHAIDLPPLPYAEDALEPVISARTLSFHYGKHHKGYVDTLNNLIADTEFADMPLEKLIKAASNRDDQAAIFNNAAQIWNHSFYWRSLSPKGLSPRGGKEPPAALKKMME